MDPWPIDECTSRMTSMKNMLILFILPKISGMDERIYVYQVERSKAEKSENLLTRS